MHILEGVATVFRWTVSYEKVAFLLYSGHHVYEQLCNLSCIRHVLRGTQTPSLNFSQLSARYLYKHLCCNMNQADKRNVRICPVFCLPDLVMSHGSSMFVSRNKWLRKKTFPWATVVSTLRVVMLYRLLFGHLTFRKIATSQRVETPAFLIVKQFPEFGNVL
jgi:hypothetical protein